MSSRHAACGMPCPRIPGRRVCAAGWACGYRRPVDLATCQKSVRTRDMDYLQPANRPGRLAVWPSGTHKLGARCVRALVARQTDKKTNGHDTSARAEQQRSERYRVLERGRPGRREGLKVTLFVGHGGHGGRAPTAPSSSLCPTLSGVVAFHPVPSDAKGTDLLSVGTRRQEQGLRHKCASSWGSQRGFHRHTAIHFHPGRRRRRRRGAGKT
jgi:hypothetical protein